MPLDGVKIVLGTLPNYEYIINEEKLIAMRNSIYNFEASPGTAVRVDFMQEHLVKY